MKKIFSFLAGMLSGALVGAVTALLLTPASGQDLRAGAEARWQEALHEGRQAMEERRAELEAQFEQARRA